jgi:hypothetical protein
MATLGSFFHVITLVWSIYLLKYKIRFEENSWKMANRWTLLHTILAMIVFASICNRSFFFSDKKVRIIWGLLDPRNLRGISPRGLEVFLYYLPLVLLFEIDFCLIVLWYDTF